MNTGSQDERRMLANIARIADALEGIEKHLATLAKATEKQNVPTL